MAGGPPPGKGQPEPAMGGAGGNGGEIQEQQGTDMQVTQQQGTDMQVTQQQGQAMSVVGGDAYSVGFILVLLILGMFKAAANRCTC